MRSIYFGKRQEYLFLFLVITAACLLRLFLILHDWPDSNADEATMGLMALHIEQGKDFPIFFYGQGYMGALQAYLGGLLFHLLGASLYSLRLGLVLIFAAFLVAAYFLIKLIYSRSFAFFCLLLYAVGSPNVIGFETFANGGYAETLLFSAFLFLLVAQMILPSGLSGPPPSRTVCRRLVHWGLLGFCTGLAVYSDILILPVLLCNGLLLYLFARREVFSRIGLLLVGGFLLALLPAIAYNLSVPFAQGTIAAYTGSVGYTAAIKAKADITFAQQFLQALLITLPDSTGLSSICYIREPMQASRPFFDIFKAQPRSCVLASIGWASGYVVLWVVASILAVRALLYYRLRHIKMMDTDRCALHWIRCMLLMSALLMFLFYAFSTPAALNPRTTARYLSGLLIVLPALIWPLWQRRVGINNLWRRRYIVTSVLLLAICLLFFRGTIDVLGRSGTYTDTIAQQETLIRFLQQHRMTRFYSDYWTCNNLIFQSQEQLLCANLDERLHSGQDRYRPYREMVVAQPRVAYVFKVHSAQVEALDRKIRLHGEIHVARTVVNGYIVYQADTPLHIS